MKEEVIAFTDPKSPVSEMFKTLRTNIQFMNTNKPLKTLLVTSTLPGEGKSWTVANLAVTFAQAGKNVLIIDADMRKGRQFGIFEVPPTPGLSNYLSGVIDGESGNYELDEFIKKTELDNLFIMPAGNVPPNPTELLVSEKMINLIGMVNERYDITIFDGTPGLLVADASIISRIVDSSIIVTAHNETKIDNVSEVKKAIENIGGKVAGVVINKIPISSKKYENTYYYGHHNTPAVIHDKKKKKLNMRKQFFKEEKEEQNIKELEKQQESILAKIHNKFEKKEDKTYDSQEQTVIEEQQPKEEQQPELAQYEQSEKKVKEEQQSKVDLKPEVEQEERPEEKVEHIIEPVTETVAENKVYEEQQPEVEEQQQVKEEQQPEVEGQQQVKEEQQVEEVNQEQEPDNQEEIMTEERIIMPVTESVEELAETAVHEQPEEQPEEKPDEKVIEQPEIENKFEVAEKMYEEQQPEAEEQFDEIKQEIEPQQEAHEEEQPIQQDETIEEEQEEIEEPIEEDNYEYVEPKLSWEEDVETESAYEQIKREINTIGYEPEPKKEEKKPENIEYQNTEYTLDKTQEILNEINRYLEEQKSNLNDGGKND